MKKASKYIGFGLLVVVVAVAALAFIAPRFGWRADAVLSGSMEPHLNVGGLAITHTVKAEDVKVGDIIVFYSPLNKKLTSHRVTAIENDPSLFFRTQGDANEDPDPFIVVAQNVRGKVCYNVPYLGYFLQSLRSHVGFLLVSFVPGLLIIGMELKNIRCAIGNKFAKKRDVKV